MTPGMMAALDADRVVVVGLVRIALPGHVVTVCDGSAVVPFGGESYRGTDAIVGTLSQVDAIAEAAGDSFPTVSLTFLPPADVTAAMLVDAGWQGAQVRIWLGVQDRETGELVPEPELLFAGEIDTTLLTSSRGARTLEIEVASVFDRLFEPDEGARLTDAFHQWVHPGELGLDQMTGTPVDRIWGPEQKNGGAVVVR